MKTIIEGSVYQGEVPPRPWKVDEEEGGDGERYFPICPANEGDYPLLIAQVPEDQLGYSDAQATAEFIVKACNSHDKLVHALRTALTTAVDAMQAWLNLDRDKIFPETNEKTQKAMGIARAALSEMEEDNDETT